jgi:hypothetical protein
MVNTVIAEFILACWLLPFAVVAHSTEGVTVLPGRLDILPIQETGHNRQEYILRESPDPYLFKLFNFI